MAKITFLLYKQIFPSYEQIPESVWIWAYMRSKLITSSNVLLKSQTGWLISLKISSHSSADYTLNWRFILTHSFQCVITSQGFRGHSHKSAKKTEFCKKFVLSFLKRNIVESLMGWSFLLGDVYAREFEVSEYSDTGVQMTVGLLQQIDKRILILKVKK